MGGVDFTGFICCAALRLVKTTQFELGGGGYAQSASEAIFRARTYYNRITYSVR